MVKLIAGPAIKSLIKIEDESVDLILTSPPYNVHFDYGVYDDWLPWPVYCSWCGRWLRECYRVLKEDGRMVLNHYFSLGNVEDGRSYPLMHLNEVAVGIGFNHHAVIFWEDRTISRRTAWGSWLSASAPYINSPYEGLLVLYKHWWKKKTRGQSTITKEEFMEGCLGVWTIPGIKGDRRKHPTAFPLQLAERTINLFTYKEETVLDPFVGSGTTVVAADKLDREGIGIDLNPKYIEYARDWVLETRNDKASK